MKNLVLLFFLLCSNKWILASDRESKGVIGLDYVGIGFIHGWNDDLDASHNELDISTRISPYNFLDFVANVGFAVSDIEGGPNNIYFDGWGNQFTLPKHNRWSFGGQLGLDLHHEFHVSNDFSIDPFLGLHVPLDYYFETEYNVNSASRVGLGFSIGSEFLFFEKFSVIPSYSITKYSYSQENGGSFTSDALDSFAIQFNYFLSNSFISLCYDHELDRKWRAWSFKYNFGY
jgi:hypothetical protein